MNHATWEHDDTIDVQSRRPSRVEVKYRRLVRRAHLPENPLGPALVAATGVAYCSAIARAFAHAHPASRVATITAILLFAFAIVPGVLMILDSAWTLARSPLQYFAQRRRFSAHAPSMSGRVARHRGRRTHARNTRARG